MDGVKFLLQQHARVHSADVGAGEVASFWDRVFGVGDDQLRVCPAGMNSMAWLAWHVARTEDVVVNLVVTAGRQVFDAGWRQRMQIDRVDIGTAMSHAEMADLSARIDLAALRTYRSAVGLRTRDVVRALGASAWDEEIMDADTARATGAGAFGPSADCARDLAEAEPRRPPRRHRADAHRAAPGRSDRRAQSARRAARDVAQPAFGFGGRGSPLTICERMSRGSSMWCCGQIDVGFW